MCNAPSFDLLEKTPCFPFYVYDADGTNRRENITDWALKHFRKYYGNKKITKWDIFYYVYGLLHHPGYRQRYADNLKRELPRIPLAPDFRAFVTAGEKLARLHLEYETLEPWPLAWIETPGVPLSYRVERMRLAKDKLSLVVNDSLTLGCIPPAVFEYRLGNRSAPGLGRRSIPGRRKQTLRHLQRPQSGRRPGTHRPSCRPGRARERRNSRNRQWLAGRIWRWRVTTPSPVRNRPPARR